MKTRLVVMVVTALLFVSGVAGAQTLPFGEIEPYAVAAVAARPPSSVNPQGTAYVLAAVGKELVAQEYDVAKLMPMRRKVVTAVPEDRAIVAERFADEIYVLSANAHDAASDDVVLFTLDSTLGIRAREVIGHGRLPSLAVSDRYVVTAFHEPRDRDASPGDLALHVTVRDRTSKQVLAGRVFEGDELLFTTAQPERSMHAVALDGDRVTLSLTGNAKILLTTASLPTLKSIGMVRIGGLAYIAAAPIHALPKHRFLLEMPSEPRILASNLTTTTTLDQDADDDCRPPVKTWTSRVALCGRAPTRITRGSSRRAP